MNGSLSDEELDRLQEVLFHYGNDDAIFDVSELDGFFTALCSSITLVQPSQWLVEVAGGVLPEFDTKAQADEYFDLITRFYNDIANTLSEALDEFEPMFEVRENDEGEVIVLEDWCFGYMRGVALAQWDELAPEQASLLQVIALHGLEENFKQLDNLSFEEHQATVPLVVEAVRELYQYHRQLRH